MKNVTSRHEIGRFPEGRLGAIGRVMDDIIGQSSEDLYGVEYKGPHLQTGRMRSLDVGDATVIVARYNETERDHMSTTIREALGVDMSRPLGHIEARLETRAASLDFALYASEDQRLVGLADCKIIDSDEVLLDDSQSCYNFAASMGLGNIWVGHMFSGNTTAIYAVELDDRQLSDMASFLQLQLERTTSG